MNKNNIYFMILFSLPGFVHADTFPIAGGFSVQALQKKADQMSCRHLRFRTGQTETNLETFAAVQPQLSQAGISGQLRSFIQQRNGYSVDLLLQEPVYRIQYPVREPKIAEALRKSQSTALWGIGYFEHQNPNGNFEQIHYRSLKDPEGQLEIEFDVRAADVCIAHDFEVVFFSGCPTETIHFDTCDYDQGVCTGHDHWESLSFVTQWWRCTESTALSFDLSKAALELGRREP